MPTRRYTITLVTTVGTRTPRETTVVVAADSELQAIEKADALAALDPSGRTRWSEINPIKSLEIPSP